MTRQEIIAEHLATLRASVAGGEENHADIAFKRVVYAALATPGCEAQGVCLADLPHLAEHVAEMADAHEALRIEHEAWGAIIDATRAARDEARAEVAALRAEVAAAKVRTDAIETERMWSVSAFHRTRQERDEARAEVATLRARLVEGKEQAERERADVVAWLGDHAMRTPDALVCAALTVHQVAIGCGEHEGAATPK